MDSKKYTTSELIKRFLPYFRPYYKTLFTDLFCAALTTICEIILPLIIRQITNTALQDVALLTTKNDSRTWISLFYPAYHRLSRQLLYGRCRTCHGSKDRDRYA